MVYGFIEADPVTVLVIATIPHENVGGKVAPEKPAIKNREGGVMMAISQVIVTMSHQSRIGVGYLLGKGELFRKNREGGAMMTISQVIVTNKPFFFFSFF